jgi:hypothetical protein
MGGQTSRNPAGTRCGFDGSPTGGRGAGGSPLAQGEKLFMI